MDENKEYLEVDEQEPEIPEETTPNLTGLFESLQSDDDEHDHDDDDEDDDHGIHTDLDDFDEDAPDDDYAENQLEQIMESRQIYKYRSPAVLLPLTYDSDKYKIAIAAPILSEGDVMGCIVFSVPRGEQTRGELEYKLAQTVAAFLGKQMEV